MIERRVRLLRKEGLQAIEIPVEFALPGEEALLQVEAGRLILLALGRPSLLKTLAGLEPIDEDWPSIEDLPPEATIL